MPFFSKGNQQNPQLSCLFLVFLAKLNNLNVLAEVWTRNKTAGVILSSVTASQLTFQA